MMSRFRMVSVIKEGLCLHALAQGGGRDVSACWWGNGLPRLRRVADLRG